MDCYNINIRQFVRLNMDSPCKLTILELNKKKVKIEPINVVVHNIGFGGLEFEAELWFPSQEDMILKFEDTIFGSLYGNIVWRNEESNRIKYGVKFSSVSNQFYQMIQKVQRVPLESVLTVEPSFTKWNFLHVNWFVKNKDFLLGLVARWVGNRLSK